MCDSVTLPSGHNEITRSVEFLMPVSACLLALGILAAGSASEQILAQERRQAGNPGYLRVILGMLCISAGVVLIGSA